MVISFWWVDTEIKNVIYASQLYKIVTVYKSLLMVKRLVDRFKNIISNIIYTFS